MRPDDIRKLLGGYATGTLTDEERRALFQAALSDQELFNALADEQALRDLLEDPAAREQLMEALERRPEPFLEQARGWLGRPLSWSLVGGLAAAMIAGVFVVRMHVPADTPEPVLEARHRAPEAPEVAPPVPAEPELEPAPAVTADRKAQRHVAGALPEEVAADPTREEESIALMAEAVAPPSEPMASQARLAMDVSQAAGIRYSMLRQQPDGTFATADPQTDLWLGDEIRLIVTVDRGGYLYVVGRDAAGISRILFQGETHASVRHEIPPGGSIRLEGPTGEQRFVVVLSQEPIPEAAVLQAPWGPGDRLVVEIPLSPQSDQSREQTERSP